MINYDLQRRWKQRRGLQACSMTWEMGCNFLNHLGREKRKKVAENHEVSRESRSRFFEGCLRNGDQKSSILRPQRGCSQPGQHFTCVTSCWPHERSVPAAWGGTAARGARGLSGWHAALCSRKMDKARPANTHSAHCFSLQSTVMESEGEHPQGWWRRHAFSRICHHFQHYTS